METSLGLETGVGRDEVVQIEDFLEQEVVYILPLRLRW